VSLPAPPCAPRAPDGRHAAPIEGARPSAPPTSVSGCPSADMLQNTVVPYQEPAAAGDKPEFASTLASTMPMAAMFTRNKFVGWCVAPFLRLEASPRADADTGAASNPAPGHRIESYNGCRKDTGFANEPPSAGPPSSSPSRATSARARTPRRPRARRATFPSSCPVRRLHPKSALAMQASAVLISDAVMALAVTYLPLFLPPRPGMPGSATEAPAPVPPQ